MTAHGNPNHPMSRFAESQWHKIAALIMLKNNLDHVEIRTDDIAALTNSGKSNIVIEEKADVIHIRLVSDQEAAQLVKKHGGAADLS